MQWEVRGLDEMIVVFRHEKEEDPLEKEMATHSSVPALEIPWIGEPGWAVVHGATRVEPDLVTKPSPPPQSLQYDH